jgi:ergothioneine biosynthesis protein EgtB
MSEPMSAIDQGVTAGSLQQRFREVRSFSERLVAHLAPEDLMVQSMPDASPAKWHLAHTTWFFETFLLSEFLPGYAPYDPEFRTVFNSYYKRLGKHPVRGTRGMFSRPTLDRVLAYRSHVNAAMDQLLASGVPENAEELVVLGLNHEQQHQELIVTDLKHAFWSQPLRPSFVEQSPSTERASGALQWTSFRGGEVEIGHTGSGFAFDNELPRHAFLLRPYRLANRLTTNREYLEFMHDGGYEKPELWLSDGWDAVQQNGWDAPFYWEQEGLGWQVFTASGTRPVALDEPVCHVSFYEADAFARWAGARLPLEGEWEQAAESLATKGNFAESGAFHPSPAPNSNGELAQMFGDVWEWTASPYVGYPGFVPAAGLVGEYNGKFMCNQFVLRGGSCATPQSHIRASYRNFFPPHARWQFMGIRLAADAR